MQDGARPKRISRRALIRAAAGGAAGLVAADVFGLEPRWLQVTRHDLPIAGLPRALEGFTVAQLTDVHLTALGGLHDEIFAVVKAIDPGLVVLTGDIFDDERSPPLVETFCRALVAPSRQIFATLGNWEHWGRVSAPAAAEVYAKSGVRLLVNEHARAGGIVVAAVDDYCSGFDDADKTLDGLPAGDVRLFLSHAPGLLDQMPAGSPRFDLVLSGHTHGGQVSFLGRPFVLPPGSGRFVAGSYDTAVGPAYVSRGIGTSELPVRMMCRPELPIFRFVRG